MSYTDLQVSLIPKQQEVSGFLSQAVFDNRHLLAGITGFVITEEFLSNLTDTPELAIPLLGWLGMMGFVAAAVSVETYHTQSDSSEKKLSSELYTATLPFIRVFLPFTLVGLTVVPAIFANMIDEDSDAQAFLPLVEDVSGVLIALVGLWTLVGNTDEWSKQRDHLLVTVSGFIALGLVNALFDISGKDEPVPATIVLPASAVLAAIAAISTTYIQQSSSHAKDTSNTLGNNEKGLSSDNRFFSSVESSTRSDSGSGSVPGLHA
ncbi:MAG: hypothetical protein CL816_02845 [Coxiellaceae bacterium]|nr:hypothetical protein [Coxiellaceae bacterium]|tara:strand:- start:3057 stop:3848 length:792 start_codon:yes stop_codon:yes gene_type:complete